MTRFRRTKAEIVAGLTPEQARTARENGAASNTHSIVLTILPDKDVDKDYTTSLPLSVEVTLNNKWFSWFCEKLEVPFQNNAALLLQCLLKEGMNEAIDKFHLPEDL